MLQISYDAIMSPREFITGHINRQTELCHCLLKSEQIKPSVTEAIQRKPFTGSWSHWLAQGQAKKNLSTPYKKTLSVDFTVYLLETDSRFKSCSFNCLASPQFFMLTKVRRAEASCWNSVTGCGSVHICWEIMICGSWDSVPLSLPLLERNPPEGRHFLRIYVQNLKTSKKLVKKEILRFWSFAKALSLSSPG